MDNTETISEELTSELQEVKLPTESIRWIQYVQTGELPAGTRYVRILIDGKGIGPARKTKKAIEIIESAIATGHARAHEYTLVPVQSAEPGSTTSDDVESLESKTSPRNSVNSVKSLKRETSEPRNCLVCGQPLPIQTGRGRPRLAHAECKHKQKQGENQ